MPSRSLPALVLTLLAFSAGCAASTEPTPSPGETADSGPAAFATEDAAPSAGTAHDTFHVYAPMEKEYEYDCAAQPAELSLGFATQGRADAVMKTLGCAWPASNPTIEIDVQIQSTTPIENQTFDLSSTPPATIEITAGLISGSADQLFSSWENNPMPTNGGPLEVTTTGTTGTVLVKSFDPTTGALDVTFTDVFLPGSSLSTGGVTGQLTIVSGEVVR